MLDAVIISDVHLGGRCTRTDDLVAFLQRLPPIKRLIVNGDLLDASAVTIPDREMLVLDRLAELNRNWWKIVYANQAVGEMRKATAHRLQRNVPNTLVGCEVVWIRGNHDPHPEKWASLLGLADVDVQDEVVVESGGKKFLVTHGHQWDPLCNKQGLFHGLGAWCARFAARWISVRFGRWLRYMSSKRAANDVRIGSAKMAATKTLDGVICGHTHKTVEPEAAWESNVAVPLYCNEGSWCENVAPTWAEIENGEVRLRTWEPGEGKELRIAE